MAFPIQSDHNSRHIYLRDICNPTNVMQSPRDRVHGPWCRLAPIFYEHCGERWERASCFILDEYTPKSRHISFCNGENGLTYSWFYVCNESKLIKGAAVAGNFGVCR